MSAFRPIRTLTDGAGGSDAQFCYINDRVKAALAAGQLAISVDTKKKELVGDFKNGGREWRPKGSPEHVRVHDFVIPKLGRAVPYGVYDIADNVGWVSVGIDHDTAAFATNAIRSWWQLMGRERYPKANSLLITADGGGNNGSRLRLWKVELQKLADELRIPITVCHLPPGTSKWNKIEHRLFSFITANWRGKPLVSHQVIVELIAATTTTAGLKVRCQLDPNSYPAGIKVTDAQSKPSTSFAMTSMANGTIPPARKSPPWSNNSRTGPRLLYPRDNRCTAGSRSPPNRTQNLSGFSEHHKVPVIAAQVVRQRRR